MFLFLLPPPPKYGSVDMRNKTAEEAYLEMLKPGENVRIKAQYRIEEFNKIKELPGDGFYVRYVKVQSVNQGTVHLLQLWDNSHRYEHLLNFQHLMACG